MTPPATAGSPTLGDGLLQRLAEQPGQVTVRWWDDGAPRSWTWQEYADVTARAAAAFEELGLRRGERVLLALRNSPGFFATDLAIVLAGGAPVSVYPTASADQIDHIISNSGARFAVVNDAGSPLAGHPAMEHMLWWRAGRLEDCSGNELPRVDPIDLERSAAALSPDHLATVIYTSGTTGRPKGVMLTQRNVHMAFALTQPFLGPTGVGKRIVSYLPTAHIAERITSHYNRLFWGVEVAVCPDISELEAYLPRVRPTLLFGPPRIWEKLAAALDRLTPERGPVAALEAIGLDGLELAIGGAAPVAQVTMDSFRAVGIRFNENYGLSESTGVMTWDAENRKPKSVGRVIDQVELRIAPDGEILSRGPHVFAGYLGDPERTREAVDAEGWLHTGDLGRLDDEGDLFIVGRKADVVITSGGKNVAAPPIEAALCEHPLVDHAVVVGDERPYVTALLVTSVSPSQLPALVAHVQGINTRFSRAEGVKAIALIADEWYGDGELVTPTLKLRRRNILHRYGLVVDALYDGGDDRIVRIPSG